MNMRIGIVGFSFGLRSKEEEPNSSNAALAYEVVEAIGFVNFLDSTPVVVTQWEISKALEAAGKYPLRSIEPHADGSYLDSQSVWEVAKSEFENCRVRQVIIIAQPFLHLPSLKRMVAADGYEVVSYELTQPIPFDNSYRNAHPWTRSKFALVIYALKIFMGMRHGHRGMQDSK